MLNQISKLFHICTHENKANICEDHKVSICHSCSFEFHYSCNIETDSKYCSAYIKLAIEYFTNLINRVEESAKKIGMDIVEELSKWIRSERDKIREVTREIETIEKERFISMEDCFKFKDILRRMIHDANNSQMYKYTN